MRAAPLDDLEFIRKHLERERAHLAGKKLLLTGATGFFGKWLTQGLLYASDQLELALAITLVTRDAAKARAELPWLKDRKEIRWLEGDIREFRADARYDLILHGAATSASQIEPDTMFDTILEGTRRVLAAAQPNGRVLFVSSGAVYGPQPSSISHIPEGHLGAPNPLDPSAAYAEAKRAAEFLGVCAAQRGGFTFSVARCFAFIGPYLAIDAHFAAGNFLRDALQNQPMRIGGDGTPLRSYLYAADLVVWLIKILLHGENAQAYNVGSDEALSIETLARTTHSVALEQIPARSDLTAPVQIAKTAVPGAPRAQYVPSIDKARNQLGLAPWTSLHSAISKSLAWHLNRA